MSHVTDKTSIGFKRLKFVLLISLPILSVVFFALSIISKDLPLWSHLFRITLSGFVGLFTNYLAIKMLFHPKDPLPWSRWQGLIPKNKPKLAKSMGETISKKLLSPDTIAKWVQDKGLISRIAPKAIAEIEKFLQQEENRNKAKKAVSAFIRNLGTENLDPMIEKLVNWLQYSVQNENILHSILKKVSGFLNWAVKQDFFQRSVKNFFESITESSLSETGALTKLIEDIVKRVQDKLNDEAFQATAAKWAVNEIRKVSAETQQSLFDWGMKELEKLFANSKKMNIIANAISKTLDSILSDMNTINLVSEQIVILLKKNAGTLGHELNETIKQNSNFFVKFAKSLFFPESKIIEILSSLSESRDFHATVRDYLKDASSNIVDILRRPSTQRKIIRFIQQRREPILEWSSSRGKDLLADYLEALLKSDGLWRFAHLKVVELSPVVGKKILTYLPSIINYMRGFIQNLNIGAKINAYITNEEHNLAAKLATKENAQKLASFISRNKQVFYALLDEKIRPWLMDHSKKILSSEAVWKWSEDAVERWIPRLAKSIERLIDSEGFKTRIEGYVPQIAASLSLDGIVESEVLNFSTDELEQMVNDVSGDELSGIEVFGGFLGLAAGTLTVLAESWIYAAVVFSLFAVWISIELIKWKLVNRRTS